MRGKRTFWHARIPSTVLLALCCSFATSSGAVPWPAAARPPSTVEAAAWLPCAPRPPCVSMFVPQPRHRVIDPVPTPQHPFPRLLPATQAPAVPQEEILRVAGRVFRVVRHLAMVASAYGRGEPGVGLYTATGTRVHVGTLAVDPRVIRLGSTLYVRGYRSPYLPPAGLLGVAEDTGGGIQGKRIDIYLDGPRSAIQAFGLQPVEVLVLSP